MKFYNREKELDMLERGRYAAFNLHSQMTVLTGRRRIGKLISTLYLDFVNMCPKILQ